ncbi:MAG: patatin-like phospholipase family protein, partial [Bacteroidota bacterium]
MDRSFHKRFLLLLSLIALSNGQPRAVADSCAKACKKYVLSIDGGGVRGIVAARILQEIETRTGKRIHELFDLIIGNSTGGILALGLAMPDPDKQEQSKYTAHDLVKFYQDNCAKIFPQGLCYQLMAGWGLWAPKYSRASLDSILHHYMQETMLSETLVPVAVTSYSLNYAAPHLWTTR